MARENIDRRLAAILSADIVGYSRLMGVAEGGTLGALRAHCAELIDPTIAKHNGRVVKLMGDGVLVESWLMTGRLSLTLKHVTKSVV